MPDDAAAPPLRALPADGAAAPEAPRVMCAPWEEALAAARAEEAPVFVPVAPHVDDCGWSLMNLFAGAMSERGQVDFSTQLPGIVKAWHRHDRQTDFWCCVSGHLKAGVHRASDGRSWMTVLGEQRPGVLVVPQYDPAAPDEHRRPHDSVAGFPWGPRHG